MENITAHFLGKQAAATLDEPESKARKLAVYQVEDGTGVDIETIRRAAALVID